MNSSYSIIYLSLKPTVQEQIAIGLLLTDGKEAYFHYSAEKFKHVSKLMSSETFEFIKNYLSGLNSEIQDTKLSSFDYLNYLSNYRNNLITFSKPVNINIDVTRENFKNLFEKFIFEYEKETVTHVLNEPSGIYNSVKTKLYPEIKQHVNLDEKLTSDKIPTLLIPVKVAFIGKNDAPVTGEIINFEDKFNHIKSRVGEYLALIKAFELEKIQGKYFVIGKEPDKNSNVEQHNTWKHIKDSNFMTFVDADETEQISDYMKNHNVVPFLS